MGRKTALKIEEILNSVTEATDRRLVRAYGRALNDMDFELRQLLKGYTGTKVPTDFAHIRNIRAIEQRYAEVESRLRGIINEYGEFEVNTVQQHLYNTYNDAYNMQMFNLQSSRGVGFSFSQPSPFQIKAVVNQQWHGSTFSDRLWADKRKLITNLRSELTQGLIQGTDPAKIIRNMRDKMGSTQYNTNRIVRTESNRVMNEGTFDSYTAYGVEKYEILATMDSATSSICQDQDGTVYHMRDKEVGVTFPPFHPNCRTTIAPFFDDEDETGKTRIARDEDGNSFKLPSNMTYNQWKGKAVTPVKEAVEEVAETVVNQFDSLSDVPAVKKFKLSKFDAESTQIVHDELLSLYNQYPELADFSVEITQNRSQSALGYHQIKFTKDKAMEAHLNHYIRTSTDDIMTKRKYARGLKMHKPNHKLTFSNYQGRSFDLTSKAGMRATANSNFSTLWNSTDDLAHTVVHEFAHYLDAGYSILDAGLDINGGLFNVAEANKIIGNWRTLSSKIKREMVDIYGGRDFWYYVRNNISRYGAHDADSAEFFAETFVKMLKTPKSEYDDFLTNFAKILDDELSRIRGK